MEYALAKELADFNVKFAFIELPKGSPHNGGCILLLNQDLITRRVASIFDKLNFFNLGQHLMNLTSSQSPF